MSPLHLDAELRTAAPRIGALRPACAVVLLIVLSTGAAPAQSSRRGRVPMFRLTATADWEFQSSQTTITGQDESTSGFVQRYLVGLDGVVWDPRFARFSTGVEFLDANRRSDVGRLSVRDFGYWAQLFLFPNRPFPLRLYARRSAADSTGGAAVNDRRELAAWGVEWKLLDHGRRQLRALYDASTLELFAPPARQQRQETALAEFRQMYGDFGEVSVQANRQDVTESVIGTHYERQNYLLNNRTQLWPTVQLLLTADRTQADATYANAEGDQLTTSRVWLQLDGTGSGRVRWSAAYDYTDSNGKYVTADNHELRATGSFRISRSLEATGGATVGRLHTGPPATVSDQDRRGGTAGLRFNRDFGGLEVGAGGNVGYQATQSDTSGDRNEFGYLADVSLRKRVGDRNAAYLQASRGRNRNDAIGVGYSLDETQAMVGTELGLGGEWRSDTSLSWRASSYDTFQFGVQDSREIGLRSSVSHPVVNGAISISSRRGISNFLPQPGNAGPIAPGTYLENRADVAAVNGTVRLTARLRFLLQATHEQRQLTQVGDENLTTWHPELVWEWSTWRIAGGVAHYERTNDTTVYRDTTWLLKITKEFL